MRMLDVRDLYVGYRVVDVLHDISMHVAKGEIVSVIGANGAGKSTLLKSVAGLLKQRSGTIRFDGTDFGTLRPDERAGVTLCPEGRRLFSEMTVLENIRIGGFRNGNRAAVRRQIEYVLGLFPALRDRRGQVSSSLSGGEQQMVAIARALMSEPKLLLLDEPTLGLAPKIIAELKRLIRQLNDDGLSILLVEQNARMALNLSQRAYVFETGKVTMEGASARLAEDPEIARIYLGA